MKKIGFPAAVVAGGFALTTLIAGCGGGGGSTQTETPQNGILSAAIIPGPSLKAGSLDLVSPVETNVAITGTFTVVGDVGTVTAVPTLFFCGSSQTITATASVTGLQFALVNTTVLPDGVTCNMKVKLQGSKANADGTYPTAEASYQFDTKAKAVDPLAWWKANAPVVEGTVKYLSSANGTPANANGGLLPTDCKTMGDDCWKASVQNRTILCSASGGSDPAVPGIGIEFCAYKIISKIFFPGKVMYCSKPFLASDGTFGTATDVEDRCQVEEIISTVGNATGELGKYISASGTPVCWQSAYNVPLKGWSETIVACPTQ